MNWKICWLPLAALAAASAAHAQPVGYAEALRQAQIEQPLLEARALQAQAAREAVGPADELPDPVLRGGITNLPVTGAAAFNPNRQPPTQIQLGVEQAIPNLAKRNAREGLALSDTQVTQARLIMARRDVAAATGQAWIGLYFAQQRLALAQAAQDDLRSLVPVARSAVAAGSARPAESLEIRRALLDLDDARTRIEADLASARARLVRFLPGSDPVASGVAPPADADTARLRANLASIPEVQMTDAVAARADAASDLARADLRPDFGVSATFGRRDPDFGNAVSVLGSVTLPLFTDKRQRPRIAAAEAQAMAAAAERQDTLRAITAQFESDLAAWHSAMRQWQRARDELLPLARDRADLETASFAAGRADLIDVIAARTALALLELDILEREAAAVEAAAVLRLTYGEQML
ncbi:MAG: TolC family protein [Alphaproteobacteria bacterium HGW-Alphaproteobacteria-7]|jgi:outer membrane protein TolC|nr:MAG: TolC family protein [Alphaproteobacteria bacterium HGW-Alphaproteobacteria-7]